MSPQMLTESTFAPAAVESLREHGMEWYSTSGLVSTLVRLHVEILRLLALIARSR